MKTLSSFFKVNVCVLLIIVSAMNVSAQISITADINWGCWSSENLVNIYSPEGTYIGGACNPSQCYYNGSNLSYSATVTMSASAPDLCGDYRVYMADSYGDGWNCGDVTIRVNGQSVGTYTLSSGSSSNAYFSLPVNVYEIASETNPQHSVANGCNNGAVKVGGGAYTNISISSNTYYDFSWNLSPSNINQGRIVSNGTGGTVVGNQNSWFSGTSTSLSVQARRSSCSWTSSSATFTYNRSTPVAGNISVNPTSSCEGGTATFSSSGSSLGDFDMFQYRWNGSGGFNDWGTSNPYNWSTHNTSGTYLQVRARISNDGCYSYTNNVDHTVYDLPATANNTTSTASVCETQTKNLTASPSGGSWSVVSGGGSISGSTYTPANVSSNTSVRIRYTVPSNGACPGSTDDVVFTVNANPATANNTTSTGAICETQTKSLTASPSGGNWSVVSGGGSISGSTYTPANVSSNTNVTIRYTVSGNGACLGSTDDVTFIVNTNPAITNNTTDNSTLCEGVDRQLTSSPSGGAWSLIAGSGSISGSSYSTGSLSSDETVTVRYTVSSNGACSGSNDDVSFTANSDNNTSSTWTGAVNSDWHNPENWSNCLPGNNTDLIIPASAPNQPIVYANEEHMSNGIAECNTIEVESGASITIKSNADLIVNKP